jgi:hypothetical protein
MPSLAGLDTMLASTRTSDARAGYALALRAVSDLADIDAAHGLAPFLAAWRERGSFDLAMRRAFAQTSASFEEGWQRRTRWRFAFLAVAIDSALGSALLLACLAPLYVSRQRKQRARLEEMRRREAVTEQSNRSATLDALMQALGPGHPPSEPDA